MLYRNSAYRGCRLFTTVSNLAEYKFQKRSFDTKTFDKKGRAEENRYFIQKGNEQIKKLKMQLDHMQKKQDEQVDELTKAVELIKELQSAGDDNNKIEDKKND